MNTKASALPLLVVAVLLTTAAPAESQPVPRGQPNLAGVELLGRGGLYSVIYERYVTERVGLGGGLAVYPGATLVPLYLSLNPIGDRRSLYISAGVTVRVTERNPEAWLHVDHRALAPVSLGYQYRSRRGLIVRPFLGVVTNGDEASPWVGISLAKLF